MTQQQPFKFPFRKTYPWQAQVTIGLPKELGSERRVFHAKGEMTFEFHATQYPDLAALKLTDLSLTLPETDLVWGRPGRSWTTPIRIPELKIDSNAIDLEGSKGFVNLGTGAFTLQFKIRLTSEIVPLLKQFQTEEVHVWVHEAGQLDLGEGNEYRAYLNFGVAPEYADKLQFYCCGIQEKDPRCDTTTEIHASLVDSSDEVHGTVFTCPGEEVHLWWNSSEDVEEATITPDIGSVAPSGYEKVNPTQTTTYTITARGECEREASVRVHVIQAHEEMTLLAQRLPDWSWWIMIYAETQWTRNYVVTSIRPACGQGCFRPYLSVEDPVYEDCGAYLCYALWYGEKENIDGTTEDPIMTMPATETPLNDYPLVGTWRFQPIPGDLEGEGSAWFILRGRCGR